MDESPLLDLSGTFDGLYGLEIYEYSEDHVLARVPVQVIMSPDAGLLGAAVVAARGSSQSLRGGEAAEAIS